MMPASRRCFSNERLERGVCMNCLHETAKKS
jgi:hypothetical protein